MTSSQSQSDALDRTGFLHELIGMMAKVVDDKPSSDRLTQLAQKNVSVNRVEEARFALGANDGAYLRANVMPLQTTMPGCDDRPLVEGLVPEIHKATQLGVLKAIEEETILKIRKTETTMGSLAQTLALALSLLSKDQLKSLAGMFTGDDQDVVDVLAAFNTSLEASTQDIEAIYTAFTENIDVAVKLARSSSNYSGFVIQAYTNGGRKRDAARLENVSEQQWERLEGDSMSRTFNQEMAKLQRNGTQRDVQKKQLGELRKLIEQVQVKEGAEASDDFNRNKRRAVWNDALRESCIAQDRLYAFVRQLSGTISENVDAICQIDEGLLVSQQREARENRQRLATQAAQEQMTLVRTVFAAVMRDSGLSLGIDSKNGKDSHSQLKVVSSTLRKQASEIASGASGTTEGYFTNSVRLENLLGSGTGEITLEELFRKLGDVGKAIQSAALDGEVEYEDGSASLDFLSAPRNSLLLRYKPESLSAVRQAFQYFQREMEHQTGRMTRRISAFELIEGHDEALCTAFATFCAHVLVHSRMYSSATAMYIGAWPAAANAQQLKISLQRLVSCAKDYASMTNSPSFGSVNGRRVYFASARNHWFW